MYYIEQVEGKLVKAAQECREAVESKEWDAALEIYENATGVKPIWHPSEAKVWWRINAPSRIKRATRLTTEDWESVSHIKGQRKYEVLARRVEAQRGGKWKVFYDY